MSPNLFWFLENIVSRKILNKGHAKQTTLWLHTWPRLFGKQSTKINLSSSPGSRPSSNASTMASWHGRPFLMDLSKPNTQSSGIWNFSEMEPIKNWKWKNTNNQSMPKLCSTRADAPGFATSWSYPTKSLIFKSGTGPIFPSLTQVLPWNPRWEKWVWKHAIALCDKALLSEAIESGLWKRIVTVWIRLKPPFINAMSKACLCFISAASVVCFWKTGKRTKPTIWLLIESKVVKTVIALFR